MWDKRSPTASQIWAAREEKLKGSSGSKELTIDAQCLEVAHKAADAASKHTVTALQNATLDYVLALETNWIKEKEVARHNRELCALTPPIGRRWRGPPLKDLPPLPFCMLMLSNIRCVMFSAIRSVASSHTGRNFRDVSIFSSVLARIFSCYGDI